MGKRKATGRLDLNRLSMDDYFDALGRWLDLEAEAERQRMARRRQLRDTRDAERTGETILGLEVVVHAETVEVETSRCLAFSHSKKVTAFHSGAQ
ncbi:MAG: hypothetical protein AAFU85_23545, partial [Planctomycetota bacterium]